MSKMAASNRMQKFLILILICFAQHGFSQNTNTPKTSTIYNIDSVDLKPDFEGGIVRFQKYIRNNFFYPDEEAHVKGIVEVNFVVEKDGTLNNIKVIKDVGHGTGNEAIRVLKKAPKWIPGTHNHRLVRVNYYLSIPVDNHQE